MDGNDCNGEFYLVIENKLPIEEKKAQFKSEIFGN